MNLEQARKLKNGQHIKVLNKGKWIDALVVHVDNIYRYGVYAHHMGWDKITSQKTSIYGSANYFDLNEIKLPTKTSGDVQDEQGATYEN